MNAAASVGARLREAREAQGWSVDEVANRLRLMNRQVDAMESDDLDSLGQPVFARGFVRNYARLLGLAPEPLLAQIAGAPELKVEAAAPPVPPPSAWFVSPWLIGLLLGVLLLLAVPVGLYWWLNSAPEDEPVAPAAKTVPRPAPAVATPAAVVETAPPTVEVPAKIEGGGDVVPVVPPATTIETPPANEAPAPAATQGVVKLIFGGDAWVEIKDATGRMVHRQLNPAGSQAVVHGQPPFDLVVGNAAQAQMTYNGRAIDLKPFIGVTVARFTLEE